MSLLYHFNCGLSSFFIWEPLKTSLTAGFLLFHQLILQELIGGAICSRSRVYGISRFYKLVNSITVSWEEMLYDYASTNAVCQKYGMIYFLVLWIGKYHYVN